MEGPKKIYRNRLMGYYHERVDADDIEYTRSDLVTALREAANEALQLMLTGSTCFGMECKYYTECICPDGECQFVLKLQAALAEMGE